MILAGCMLAEQVFQQICFFAVHSHSNLDCDSHNQIRLQTGCCCGWIDLPLSTGFCHAEPARQAHPFAGTDTPAAEQRAPVSPVCSVPGRRTFAEPGARPNVVPLPASTSEYQPYSQYQRLQSPPARVSSGEFYRSMPSPSSMTFTMGRAPRARPQQHRDMRQRREVRQHRNVRQASQPHRFRSSRVRRANR